MHLLLWVLAGGLAFASIAGLFSRHWWVFDMLSHLRAQYAIVACALVAVALIAGEIAPAGGALITGLFNAILVVPQLPGRRRPLGARSGDLRILFSNVFEKNHQYARLVDVIESAGADVIVMAEVDADAIAEVRLRLPGYRYFEQRMIGPRGLGIGLLSRIAPESSQIIDLGESGSPLVIARFAAEPTGDLDRPVTIIGAHPLPPHRDTWFRQRNAYMAKLADVALAEGAEGREVIIVGDFNSTPWAWHFRRFLRHSELHDSRHGFGLQTSWPSFLPAPLRIPIDHCFLSHGLTAVARCVLGSTGSDHLPIVVDVVFVRG